MRKTRELFKPFPRSMAPQEACRTDSEPEAHADTACRSFCGGLCISVGTILFNSLSLFLIEISYAYCIYIIFPSAFSPTTPSVTRSPLFLMSMASPLFLNYYCYIFINTACSSSRDVALWDFPYPFWHANWCCHFIGLFQSTLLYRFHRHTFPFL